MENNNSHPPIQNTILKMGSNFLISALGINFLFAALVPAVAFIISCSLAFDPVLPMILKYDGTDTDQAIQSSIRLLFFSIMLGFFLYTLSPYIYKVFEGYTLIFGGNNIISRSLLRYHKRNFVKIGKKQSRVTKQLISIQNRIDRENIDIAQPTKRQLRYLDEEQALKDQLYDLTVMRESNFPPSIDSIAPTRFGNILKAAQTYPVSRYRIDTVQLWSRLSYVIPDTTMAKIELASSQCLFLINSSLLSLIFMVIAITTVAIQSASIWMNHNNNELFVGANLRFDNANYQENIILYVVLSIIAAALAWFFYEASLNNIRQFGDMIRTAYDLHRFDLLDALHLELPNSLMEEQQVWLLLSQLMAGNQAFGKIDLIYHHRDARETKNKIDLTYRRGTR